MNISMTKTTHPGKLPPADRLGFGSVFTDHMFLMNYTDREGWHNARIVPFGPISISPAASVLHYGTEVFEGLKAYRRPDGAVQLFRPWENVARLNRSCDRLGLPRIDERDGLQAIRELVKMDAAWVPSAPGTSLYIRPFLYSTDPTLALHGVHEATFAIILSPSGSYFSDGLKPVPIMVETEDVRAVRGGTGEAKCGGNYAASVRAGERAEEKGYSQVLWLDGVERKYIEEVGAMNIFFKINGTASFFCQKLTYQTVQFFMFRYPSISPFQPFSWLMEYIVRKMIVHVFIKHKCIGMIVYLIKSSKCL